MRVYVRRPPMGVMDPRALGDIKLGDIKTQGGGDVVEHSGPRQTPRSYYGYIKGFT